MMRCPVCASPLLRLDRDGLALARCPGYQGAWLGAAELAALADRLLLAPLVRGPRPGGPACRACLERENEGRRARQALLAALLAPARPGADAGRATDVPGRARAACREES